MTESAHQPVLYLITGSRGAGKTSFCQALILAARAAGWRTAGLVSNPVFEGARRIEIVAENVLTGAMHLLATRKEPEQPGQAVATRHWQFDEQAIAWGNEVIEASLPADLFVLDELGTLEFERQQGWQAGFAAIDSHNYRVALVVIRPELLADALQRWPDAYIIEIDTPEDSQEKAKYLIERLFR